MCKHWDLGYINKNSLTSGKYFLKDILLQCMYVILYFNPYEKKNVSFLFLIYFINNTYWYFTQIIFCLNLQYLT